MTQRSLLRHERQVKATNDVTQCIERDAFVRAIKVVVAPIIFTTIAVGIAKMGDIRHVANVGVKALIYFEVASTLALIIGMTVGNFWQVGVGLNADPAAFDPKAVEAYAKLAKNVTMSDFFLSIIPTSLVEPFDRALFK